MENLLFTRRMMRFQFLMEMNLGMKLTLRVGEQEKWQYFSQEVLRVIHPFRMNK